MREKRKVKMVRKRVFRQKIKTEVFRHFIVFKRKLQEEEHQ